MVVLYMMMRGIRQHYDLVRAELYADVDDERTLPSRVHAIVLLSKLHKPTMRALAYARATRPSVLEAVTVNVDSDETAALEAEWERRGLPVPLKVLDSPYREVTRTVVDYVRSIRRGSPRDVVTVFIPEYVVGHWWEHLLHNQSALRLEGSAVVHARRHGGERAMATQVVDRVLPRELDGQRAGSEPTGA